MNNGGRVSEGICAHVQCNQPCDIIKYIVDVTTTAAVAAAAKCAREAVREREGENSQHD